MCSQSKEQSIIARETVQKAFFAELCRFFDLDFFPLSRTPQPSVGTRMRCSCFFLSNHPTITHEHVNESLINHRIVKFSFTPLLLIALLRLSQCYIRYGKETVASVLFIVTVR